MKNTRDSGEKFAMPEANKWLACVGAILALALGGLSARAQTNIAILHSFADSTADGSFPEGQPLLIGSLLYGVTFYGGDSDAGTIFRVSTNGSDFSVVYSFEGDLNGGDPFGSLVSAGNSLYGMTFYGGIDDGGVVYRVRTNGANYAVLHTFVGGNTDGVSPYSSLVVTGSTLYGMTANGGTNNAGVVFKINTNATGFAVLHSFSGGPNDGSSPSEGVTLGGTSLYGTTYFGGSNDLGIVFSMVTNGSNFKVLHHFGISANDGANPSGPLTLNGSTLYGITTAGGIPNAGTVFKINADGTGYTRLHDFVGGANDGAFPQFGPLLVTNALVYGATENGGTTNAGVLFQMTTNGTGFTVLHSFSTNNVNDGAFPFYPPILGGSSLYGVTLNGGSNDLGVVYGPGAPVPPVPPMCTNVPAVDPAGVVIGNVVAGQTYAYQASGCVHNGPGNTRCPPDGGESTNDCVVVFKHEFGNSGFTCPGLASWSLVGKVGGTCIQLGANGLFVAPSSGPMTLYFNDDGYGDNSLYYDVCITPVAQLCTNVPGTASAGVPIGNVVAGQTYSYQASGCSSFDIPGNQWSDPDGRVSTNFCASFDFPPQADPTNNPTPFLCPGMTNWSLVGKVGGTCIQMGKSGTFIAPASGTLTLFTNDELFFDNGGSWDVCITLGPPTTVCSNVPATEEAGVPFGTVKAGNTYTFTATGTASFDCSGGLYVDADGLPYGGYPTNGASFHCQGLKVLSLVGSVNGSCIQLGTSGAFTAPSTGELRLFMNDTMGAFVNNCGQWDVCVTDIGVFRITAITRATNNITITWLTTGGLTNAVQVTPGIPPSGSYTTNTFVNLSGPMIIPGYGPTTASYTEAGGATNRPTRFYRVRLVP